MFKVKNKIKFNHSENRMKNEGNVSSSILEFGKNKNLFFLLKERYNWMNNNYQVNTNYNINYSASYSKVSHVKDNGFKL